MSKNKSGRPDPRLQPPTPATRPEPAGVARSEHVLRQSPTRVFALLLSLRVANALIVRTFFQPDEYFQSLEPAWQLAFGPDSGAWITWEWRAELRSSLHPALFAAVYKAAEFVAKGFHVGAGSRAELLIAAPKICQAYVAALGDYYTWRLAGVAYGPDSRSAIATLALTALSPWQWFCSTRTLSNSLESTFTVAALSFWPWNQVLPVPSQAAGEASEAYGPTSRVNPAGTPTPTRSAADAVDRQSESSSPSDAWPSLLLAATACILRPTNALIWLAVGAHALLKSPSWPQRGAWFRQAVICGCVALGLAALSDRLYYGEWTLPPLRFLHFNIARDLAVFYGRNRADYYLTEGLPLLLTTALPFASYGLWQALFRRQTAPSSRGAIHTMEAGRPHVGSSSILSLFAWTVVAVTAVMSLIAHKEVRFLYPLLPLLHVLSGGPLSQFTTPPLNASRKAVLALLLTLTGSIVLYTTQYHQRGVVDVTHVLRDAALAQHAGRDVTAASLMPCHSTPWRSHLVAPNLRAWALTCEPPLDVPLAERAGYLDEADMFYADPAGWLAANMEELDTTQGRQEVGSRREWPDYLVFFEALEQTVGAYEAGAVGRRYREYWRGFNSHWHDDWRRRGDVIVWQRV